MQHTSMPTMVESVETQRALNKNVFFIAQIRIKWTFFFVCVYVCRTNTND